MKRILLIVLLAITTMSVRCQIIAGFDCHSPNAWFNKDIYFLAYNQAQTYNYWTYSTMPMYFQEIYACVNHNIWYKIEGGWNYGTYITLENADLDQGSTVELYGDGMFLGSWVCDVKQPTFKDNVLRLYKNKPHTKPNPRSIQKFMKVLEKNVPKILKKIK